MSENTQEVTQLSFEETTKVIDEVLDLLNDKEITYLDVINIMATATAKVYVQIANGSGEELNRFMDFQATVINALLDVKDEDEVEEEEK